MQDQTDSELLHAYAAAKSDAAFAEIVRRYSDLVYSAALRQAVDADQARDLAQSVFADLAAKAGSLPKDARLVGWLYRGVRFAALEHHRKERRRHERERTAMEMSDSPTDAPTDWSAIRPILDSAMAVLDDRDRDAILLRFFRNESLAAVGAALGVSEDAAQKRVSRALVRVRDLLAKRGIRTTDATLSAALAAHAVEAAPAGFAGIFVAHALTAGPAALTPVALPALSKMKIPMLKLAVCGGFATLVLLNLHTRAQLHRAETLIRQQVDEIASLQTKLAPQAAASPDNSDARNTERELLRLRAEVARLRAGLADQKPIVAAPLKYPATTAAAPATPQIFIRSRFLSVPGSYVTSDATGLLSDEQATNMLPMLESQGANLLSAPAVITLSGRRAQLMTGSTVPIGGVQTNLGLTMDLLPETASNSTAINLAVAVRLSRLADDSPAQDGSQLRVETDEITNSIAIPVSQTLILTHRVSGIWPGLSDGTNDATAGARSLIVLITPQLIDAAGNIQVQTAAASSEPDGTVVSNGRIPNSKF